MGDKIETPEFICRKQSANWTIPLYYESINETIATTLRFGFRTNLGNAK